MGPAPKRPKAQQAKASGASGAAASSSAGAAGEAAVGGTWGEEPVSRLLWCWVLDLKHIIYRKMLGFRTFLNHRIGCLLWVAWFQGIVGGM
jgi:hypothetical protein